MSDFPSDVTNTDGSTIQSTRLSEQSFDPSSRFDLKKIGASFAGVLLVGGAIWWMTQPATVEVVDTPVEVAPVEAAPVAVAPAAFAEAKPVPVAPALESRLKFKYKEAKINDKGQGDLDQWAERLSGDRTATLQIEGHTDERGSDKFNVRLGERRAVAAKLYLMKKGIDKNRLQTMSYGESRPTSLGHDEASWAENRRVELKEVTALTLE